MQRSVSNIIDNRDTVSLPPAQAVVTVRTDVPDAPEIYPALVKEYSTPLKDDNPCLNAAEPSSSFFQASRNVAIHGGQFNSTMGHHTSLTVHIGQVPLSNTESAFTEPAHSTSKGQTEACNSLSGNLCNVELGPSVPDSNVTVARHNPARHIPPAIHKCNEIYEKQLSTKGRGFPLWIPGPNRRLPITYRKEGVGIGDVGIITPFGGFSFLFNICLPADDPINLGRVPEEFEPICPQLDASMDICEFFEFTQGDYLATASIEGLQSDVSSSDLVFESTASEGAILTMPEGAISFDLENIPHFRTYAASNVESWYRYANGPRGREAKNGDIRLVTGCDKTTSWGVAVLENVSQERKNCLRFKAATNPRNPSTCTYTWECSGMVKTSVGPDRQEVNHLRGQEMSLDEGSDGTYMNQCLFVRTLNLTLGAEMWENLNEQLALMASSGSMQNRKLGDSSRNTSAPENNSSSASQEGSSLARHGASAFDIADSEHKITMTTTPENSSFHPSRYLNELLMEKFPATRLIITHDGDWTSALKGELPVSTYSKEALLDRVLDKHDIIHDESGEKYTLMKTNSITQGETKGVLYLDPKKETLPSLYPLSSKIPDMHAPDVEKNKRVISFKSPDSRLNYQKSPFYQITQNESSRSLPDYLTNASEDSAATQLRRFASSSMTSSASGFYSNRDLKNFTQLPHDIDSGCFEDFDVPSLTQGDESSTSSSIDVEGFRGVIAAESPGSRQMFKKSAKTSVSTPAGHLASERRRTNPGRFLCTLKDCSATFTRKLGLDNHLKSHLGIRDQKCDFCQRSFSTSLGRHMKRCKQNPNRQEASSSKEIK